MARKKSWFQLVKRFFISEAKTNDKPGDKKVRRRKRWFFGRFKLKSLPVIEAPPLLLQKDRALIQAEESHSKHALTAAIATAAAAEAAVAAAQAAAEIVRLTGGSHRAEIRGNDLAAIRIQTAFRGYLARKALRALKGLVRLQAMVRGRAVRRQVITSLQELQSLVKIQTRVREWKAKMAESNRIDAEKEHLLCQTKELKDIEPMIKINTQKRCSESLQMKEGCNAITLSRLESSTRRKHIREYFLSHQNVDQERKNVETLTESEPHNVKEKLNQYWLENWVDSNERREGEEKNNGSVVSSYPLMQKDIEETSLPKLGELIGLTTVSLPRRSFHHHQPKRHSIGESFSRSPSIPNYMSATESAKAKARSTSTPKQRSGYLDYSDHDSPSKNRLSFSSVGSDTNITPVKNGRPPSSIPQISPKMKRLLVPIKSNKTSKDLSIDSECSLLNLDQNNFFR